MNSRKFDLPYISVPEFRVLPDFSEIHVVTIDHSFWETIFMNNCSLIETTITGKASLCRFPPFPSTSQQEQQFAKRKIDTVHFPYYFFPFQFSTFPLVEPFKTLFAIRSDLGTLTEALCTRKSKPQMQSRVFSQRTNFLKISQSISKYPQKSPIN